MPQFPTSLAVGQTQQQGNDMIAAINTLQVIIGLLSSPDPNSTNAKLNSIIASIGTASTASTMLKFLSDITGGLGISTSSAAANPSSNATAIGFLKLISSYLQTINHKSGTCTKATAALSTTSAPIITSSSKNLWMIENKTANSIFLEYGGVATITGGIPVFSNYLYIDDYDFTGAVNGIVATGTASVDYRVFTT